MQVLANLDGCHYHYVRGGRAHLRDAIRKSINSLNLTLSLLGGALSWDDTDYSVVHALCMLPNVIKNNVSEYTVALQECRHAVRKCSMEAAYWVGEVGGCGGKKSAYGR